MPTFLKNLCVITMWSKEGQKKVTFESQSRTVN